MKHNYKKGIQAAVIFGAILALTTSPLTMANILPCELAPSQDDGGCEPQAYVIFRIHNNDIHPNLVYMVTDGRGRGMTPSIEPNGFFTSIPISVNVNVSVYVSIEIQTPAGWRFVDGEQVPPLGDGAQYMVDLDIPLSHPLIFLV